MAECPRASRRGARARGRPVLRARWRRPPTPFPWSFDLSEEEAAAKLESCPEGAVLVVHSPPRGHVDEVHGRHLGSRAILRAVERTRPALVLCGHVHQCWGEEAEIGTTPVVNVGPEGRFFDI